MKHIDSDVQKIKLKHVLNTGNINRSACEQIKYKSKDITTQNTAFHDYSLADETSHHN